MGGPAAVASEPRDGLGRPGAGRGGGEAVLHLRRGPRRDHGRAPAGTVVRRLPGRLQREAALEASAAELGLARVGPLAVRGEGLDGPAGRARLRAGRGAAPPGRRRRAAVRHARLSGPAFHPGSRDGQAAGDREGDPADARGPRERRHRRGAREGGARARGRAPGPGAEQSLHARRGEGRYGQGPVAAAGRRVDPRPLRRHRRREGVLRRRHDTRVPRTEDGRGALAGAGQDAPRQDARGRRRGGAHPGRHDAGVLRCRRRQAALAQQGASSLRRGGPGPVRRGRGGLAGHDPHRRRRQAHAQERARVGDRLRRPHGRADPAGRRGQLPQPGASPPVLPEQGHQPLHHQRHGGRGVPGPPVQRALAEQLAPRRVQGRDHAVPRAALRPGGPVLLPARGQAARLRGRRAAVRAARAGRPRRPAPPQGPRLRPGRRSEGGETS